jgi:hypothetical protein
VARGGPCHRTWRGSEPHPRRRAVGSPARAGWEDQRDGRQQRPASAQGHPRPQQRRPPARPGHDTRGHPRHHARAHAVRPRRRRRPPPARSRHRGRRVPPPARRLLVAGRQRGPAGGAAHQAVDGVRPALHPQRLRSRLPRPLRPVRPTAPADELATRRLRGRRPLAATRPRGRARHWRHHGTRAAFERDKGRDAELHGRQITALRFTSRQVTRRHRWVAARLRPSLAPRSPDGSS